MSQQIDYKGEWERIDTFLRSEHPDYARHFFHHLIERWAVTVNEKNIKKSYKLRPWDTITIDNFDRYTTPLLLDNAPQIDIPVVHEGEWYLVLNKPKWVLSHPTSNRDTESPSVVGFLHHKYARLPSTQSFIRAGLVHRLDKETDGLMIVTLNETTMKHFRHLFDTKSACTPTTYASHTQLTKKYYALCLPTDLWKKNLRQIDTFPHLIDKVVRPAIAAPYEPKQWLTIINRIDTWQNGYIWVDCEIVTGRTHQIRYHLSHLGLPIIGDYLYGWTTNHELWLRAYHLSHIDLEGKTLSHTLPIPSLDEYIKKR